MKGAPSGLDTTVPIRRTLVPMLKESTLLEKFPPLLPVIVENWRLEIPARLPALTLRPPAEAAVLL